MVVQPPTVLAPVMVQQRLTDVASAAVTQCVTVPANNAATMDAAARAAAVLTASVMNKQTCVKSRRTHAQIESAVLMALVASAARVALINSVTDRVNAKPLLPALEPIMAALWVRINAPR